MIFTRVLTLVALVGSALVGGVFFAYGNSVMPALERMPDGQGAAAMNLINVTIYNPLFMLILNGSIVVGLVLAIVGFVRKSRGKWWLLGGFVLYLIGIMITGMVNVPVTDQLAAVDPATPEGAAAWARFVTYWNPTNNLRAVTSTLSVIAFGIALATPERSAANPAQVQQNAGPYQYGPQHSGPAPR